MGGVFRKQFFQCCLQFFFNCLHFQNFASFFKTLHTNPKCLTSLAKWSFASQTHLKNHVTVYIYFLQLQQHVNKRHVTATSSLSEQSHHECLIHIRSQCRRSLVWWSQSKTITCIAQWHRNRDTILCVSVSSFLPVCASLTHACLSGLFLSLHLQLDWAIIFVNTPPHCISCAHSWCLSDLFKCFLESQSVAVSHLWLDFTENIVTGTFKTTICLLEHLLWTEYQPEAQMLI